MSKDAKKFIFVAGLPRSGSTLLCNALAQNPSFQVDAVSSGLCPLLSMLKEKWDNIEALRTWPDEDLKRRCLKGLFHSYYSESNYSVVFDKYRGWLNHLETLETVLEAKPKVIVCVRDMRSIMASWEKLWRKNRNLHALDIPVESRGTIEARVAFWGSSKGHTGSAWLAIQDALQRGYKSSLLFMDFDRWTADPKGQFDRIYQFIGEKSYSHDFESVAQRNIEMDPVPWMKDLHKIRPKIEQSPSNWEEILGPQANGLAKSNSLWDGLT